MNKTEKKEIKKIVLEGSLTIQQAEEIKNTIWNIDKKYTGVDLDLSKTEQFDLSFLQILFMAGKKFKKEGKSFLVNTGGKTQLMDAIYKAGLERQLNSIFYSE